MFNNYDLIDDSWAKSELELVEKVIHYTKDDYDKQLLSVLCCVARTLAKIYDILKVGDEHEGLYN